MKLTAKLYKHQQEALEWLKDKPYAILGLEMGLGKSLIAIARAVEVGAKDILIVCPSFLKSNWLNELEKFTVGLNVTISSYASLKKVMDKEYDFVIADEAHYLKNHKSQRSKNFESLLVMHSPNNVLLLTGTPIKNRVGEFWNLLRLCHMGGKVTLFNEFARKNQFFKFQYYFSNAITQYFGYREVTKFVGYRNLEELKPMLNSCRLRIKSKDVLNLPEVSNIDFQIKKKSKFDKDFEELINEDVREGDPAYMVVKKNNAIAKCDYTVKLAQEILENGEKVIVFSDHIKSANEIARQLGVKAISGEVPASRRAELVDIFEQSADTVPLVATIPSLSVGVNLTSCNYMIFNDLPFVPADLDQAKKRIHRIGQKNKCFYYYVYISDMDKNLQKMIYDKRKITEKV